MKKRTSYPKETKARALAALLTGERSAVIARDLGVPEATVRSWRYRLKNGQTATLKKGNFGDLLFDYLETELRSLIAQSRHLADPELLEKTRAGELAIVAGTLFDRTWRMLEFRRIPALEIGEPGRHDTPKRSRRESVTQRGGVN